MKLLKSLFCITLCSSMLLISCNKSELDSPNDTELAFMFLTEDLQLETQTINTVNIDLSETASTNTIDARSDINEKFEINRSRGSISDFDSRNIKKLKWDIEFNAKTNKVSGSGRFKLVANDGEFDWDLELEALCTEVWGKNNDKALNLFKVVKANSIGTNKLWRRAWGNLDTAPFILFNSKDGNTDKISGFAFVEAPTLNTNLRANDLTKDDRCHFLVNTLDDIPFTNTGANPTSVIPDDDWLIVKGLN